LTKDTLLDSLGPTTLSISPSRKTGPICWYRFRLW